MATRTEVIQALHARDELQNRDITLILDYLEQEAGSSSSTRDTILRSRRRIQDEVTPRDIGAIYDYLAELGTPAVNKNIFVQLLRRRDIVSRRLGNIILDLIDAANFLPDPPFLANLIHWYDGHDKTTMWQDVAGTIPIVDLADVARIDDKGLRGDNLTQSTAGQRPQFQASAFSGIGGIKFTEANSDLLAGTDAIGRAGGDLSMAGVFEFTVTAANKGFFEWDPGPRHSFGHTNSNNARVFISGFQVSLGSFPGGANLVGFLSTDDGANVQEVRTSNEGFIAPGAGVSNGPDPGASLRLGFELGDTDRLDDLFGQILIYDTALSAVQLDTLEAYFTSVEGVTWVPHP